MNNFQSIKSIGVLSTAIVCGFSILPSLSNAQCANCQTLPVPMSGRYGVNPYQPQVRFSVQFTPLQQALYRSPQPVSRACDMPAMTVGEIYIGQVPAPEAPVHAISESGSSGLIVTPKEPAPVAETEIDSLPSTGHDSQPEEELKVGSIPSPSDIQVAPQKPDEPTPADPSTHVSSSDLRDAQTEIERLKVRLEEAKEKARVAVDRAYAAERAAMAAAETTQLKLEELQKLSREQQQAEKDSLLTFQTKEREMAALVQRLESEKAILVSREQALKQELEQARLIKPQPGLENPDSAPSRNEHGDGAARKLLEQLLLDAKARVDEPTTEEGTPKQASDGNRAGSSVEEQVNKWNQSMERQIKKSSEQISRVKLAEIDELLGSGKKETDPEVMEARQNLKTELEENEAKIRKRIEKRIQRVRNEADSGKN